MPSFPPEFWTTGAPWGLVAIFILLVATGRLRTAKELKDREADWKKQLKESAEHSEGWKSLAMSLLELSGRRSEQMDRLLETGKVTETVLKTVSDQISAGEGTTS